jgi:hypothetical protein
MLKDHEIKDELLKALAGIQPDHFITVELMADFLEISKERTFKLLEEIRNDSFCTRTAGYGNDAYRYFGNKDTKPFYKSGGYRKRARAEFLKNLPANKWYLLGPVKFIGGAIVGAAIALAVQRLMLPKSDLPNNTRTEPKNIDTVGKDSIPAPILDTSK